MARRRKLNDGAAELTGGTEQWRLVRGDFKRWALLICETTFLFPPNIQLSGMQTY